MSPAKIRSDVIKLSELSTKKPDYYFIQGYLMGLGVLPQLLVPSEWHPDLFGEFNIQNETELKYLESLMALYNQSMDKIIQNELKMPAKCSLSKQDYRESLKPNMPLPNYCKGVLQALKNINKRMLNTEQKRSINSFTTVLKAFTSPKIAAKEFGEFAQYNAQEYKRNYVYFMADAIFELRFSNERAVFDENEAEFNNHFLDEEPNELDEFDELLELVLADTELKALEPMQMLLEIMESGLITKQFIKDNTGYFWGLHETRPYMMLRAHRAKIHALHGYTQKAQSELEELLKLNPNDNQANRFLLMNCLIINKQWEKLEALLADFDFQELHTTASRALSAFVMHGDSKPANEYKKMLQQQNKHFSKILTGQEKLKEQQPSYFSPGSKEEVAVYLDSLGKQAWISVPASLFWLRKK
ncbi:MULTISPECIES: UPF0149 family protein [unclassified Pseudoalteromonas]|uniref:UPF0149 family protein n=1 Tax=unclassified Pseudoalteromonas TaxID=194690 RepID=UPI000411E3CA|nr:MULTISPECIES: UPF0149 family protein [unclassified Pseudoalteromonas]MBH0061873.1 UPF0149 family protein [Pseudoalteromonas sp. NZS71]PKH89980.1 hypothetical protein CXF76_19345 [Pseudoalteromonas sp. 78C3]